MNKDIRIKEEPVDYDDIVPEVRLHLQTQQAKDINLNNIKAELDDDFDSDNEGFEGFRITDENEHVITLSVNSEEKEDDEIKFMELLNILGNARRPHPTTSDRSLFTCVFNCGALFSNRDECTEHEIEEAKKFYENGKLTIKKRKVADQSPDKSVSLCIRKCYTNNVKQEEPMNNHFMRSFTPITYGGIQIKKEISEDLEPDKAMAIPENIEVKVEPSDVDDDYMLPNEKDRAPNYEDDTTPIPKIKIPASLLNSLKAAQNAPKVTKFSSFRNFDKIAQPFEIRADKIAISHPLTLPKNPIKRKPITVPAEIPNKILQPITIANSQYKLVHNPQIKIIKLPPNTKIIKLEPKEISPTTSPTPTSPFIQHETKLLTQPLAGTKIAFPASPTTEKFLKEQIIMENKRQKAINFVPKPTLEMIEQLPESKKAINELLQKVKQAQQLCPNQSISLTSDDNITMNSDNITMNSDDSNSSIENQIPSVLIDMCGDDSILFRMRQHYPNLRSFWVCPYCPRQYALRNTLRYHLEKHHQLTKNVIESLTLQVKLMHLAGDLSDVKKAVPIEEPKNNTILESPRSLSPIAPPVRDNLFADKPKKKPKEVFTCEKCGRKCSSRVTLRDHIAANCSREPQYQCSQCPKKFFSVSTLNCHVTIHTGELPHKCSYCDKRFRTRGQVTVHHRTHTGERPFKCQVCSQSFTHRETLIAHLSRHIGMKRYKCYACNKQFSCISGLRTHRDTRPDTCGKVKFNPRALGPRVRVVKGNVIFEPQPEINPYLRSDSPPEVNSD